MFEGDNYLVQNEDGVEFRNYREDFGEGLDKSKLVVPYVNIPLTLNLRFRNHRGRRTFNLSAGGYVGYRIGGHTKIRLNGDNDRERGNYFLNKLALWSRGTDGL